MNWFYLTIFIFVQLFSPGIILLSGACWGNTAPKYGDTTTDYDLLVGSELIINCTLKAGISQKVDSSHLVFRKNKQIFSHFTQIIDPHTAQLLIPNARVNDSGTYFCELALPYATTNQPLVCTTKVIVGHPPRNVSNFRCISRNFDNLTCTWDIEHNQVKTDYSLSKKLFSAGVFQTCPVFNNTFCQWRINTDPPYVASNRNLIFIVHGNNSLGVSDNEFMLDHFEIVIPNSPESLTSVEINNTNLTVQWLPPTMRNITEPPPPLYYQLWLEELGSNPHDRIVVDVGIDKFSYTVDGLIPYYLYNISLRCRSQFTVKEEMWSAVISHIVKTKADVPTVLPEVHAQAYELSNFESYRNATLYWKPIPERYFNGEDFHYYITYHSDTVSGKQTVLFEKSKYPNVVIGHLNSDSSYIFQIYSANKEGISQDYKTIYIAERNKIPPIPKDIRVISHDLGYYNLTWEITGNQRYTVFWCSSVNPSKSRCDGPIHWSNSEVKENSFILNATDVHNINLQFAIAAKVGNESSGMEWASCIVPHGALLGKIPIRRIEKGTSILKVIWSLDCKSQKSIIDRYEITYCRIGRNTDCKVVEAAPNDESIILSDLHPFSNYSIKLKAFNKGNISSIDIEESYESTLAGGRPVLIGFAIGGTLALAIFMLVFYRLVKWMHDKIHQMKNIAVRLPKDLEGPELNPLSNYESFKKGLIVQKSQNSKGDRLSYVFEESENKNRHGSGSSQFSNSSADELVFKNGKCTKFGRKPSGDSSGCSSMSSNTTTRIHLSSDSGTESDFIASASPDSVLMECNGHNLQKPHLPILIEQEAFDLTPELCVNPQTNQLSKYSNCIKNTNLEVKHPYSKFGISGVQSGSSWCVNSLAFYSCNLANSEPSVFDAQTAEKQMPSVFAPYSKIGLAKSSGDILPKSLGYSKFGLAMDQDCFYIDVAHLDPAVNRAMIQKFQNNKYCCKEMQKAKIPPFSNYVSNTKEQLSDKLDHKPKMASSIPQKLASGYVSIGDVRCVKDSSLSPISANSADFDYLCDNSLLQVESGDFHLPWIQSVCGDTEHISASPNTHVTDLQHLSLSKTSHLTHPVPIRHLTTAHSQTLSDSMPDIFNHGTSSKSIPPTDSILPMHKVSPCINQVSSNHDVSSLSRESDSKNSIRPCEIILTPVVSRNGYVPFSNFSSPSNKTVPFVPNTVELNNPLSVFPGDTLTDFDQNYITPSNKGDMKLLQDNLVSKINPSPIVVAIKGKDTFTGGKVHTMNSSNISKISGSLKHLLKPLPKMESEICEV